MFLKCYSVITSSDVLQGGGGKQQKSNCRQLRERERERERDFTWLHHLATGEDLLIFFFTTNLPKVHREKENKIKRARRVDLVDTQQVCIPKQKVKGPSKIFSMCYLSLASSSHKVHIRYTLCMHGWRMRIVWGQSPKEEEEGKSKKKKYTHKHHLQ